jgi:hypothetical protein
MRRAGLLGGVVVLVLGALFIVRPFIAQQRDFVASMPSPASLRETTIVPLVPGERTCFGRATIDPYATEMRFNVSSPSGPAPAIGVHVWGDAYDFRGEVPAGTLDTQQVRLPIQTPPGTFPVRVCFRSRGKQEGVGLFASADRTRSRSIAHVDGRKTDQSIWFAFSESTPHTFAERLSATVQRMTVFRPGYVGEGLVWVLLVLFLIGVPAAVVWAYARAVAEVECAEPRELDVSRRRSWWRRLTD